MKSFALLWASLLDSSLWIAGSKDDRLVFIALIVLKDKNGHVHITPLGLARRANVTFDECKAALHNLSQPDPLSGNTAHEGRRIIPLPNGDGWEVVSHEKYRFSSDAARAYWRDQKATQRAKSAVKKRKQKPEATAGETAYVKAAENGASEEQLNKMVTQSLPRRLQ